MKIPLFEIKFLKSLLLSTLLSPLLSWVEKFVFADWEFLQFLLVLLVVDTVLGLVYAYRSKTISSNKFASFFLKVLLYGSFLILIHVLTSFTEGGETTGIFGWFRIVGYGALMTREGISIVENIGKISPNLLGSKVLEKLKQFDNQGKYIKE